MFLHGLYHNMIRFGINELLQLQLQRMPAIIAVTATEHASNAAAEGSTSNSQKVLQLQQVPTALLRYASSEPSQSDAEVAPAQVNLFSKWEMIRLKRSKTVRGPQLLNSWSINQACLCDTLNKDEVRDKCQIDFS